MANYNLIAYFKGETEDGCTQFSIRFIPTFGDHLPWREVELAGETPVIVQYTSNSNPFIPIMESRCSITAVANEYFMSLYGPDIQHCQVILMNEDTGEYEWVGFLTNNLMNMPMDSCVETFTFEAIDCLSTLEYFDYAPLSGKKQIVTFQDILADIAQNCMLIERMVVDSSIKNESGQTIHMDELMISEQNFFSSDTDEPWNKKDVLTEICRWCGYTAFQWKNSIYLFDKQAHTDNEWNVNTDSNQYFLAQISSGDFHTYVNSGDYIRCCNVTEDNIAGTGADISLQTIYNKVTVEDSFYEIGEFIPDLYNDEMLENVKGDFWLCDKQLKIKPYKAHYINKSNKIKEDADDNEKDFYQRLFKHKWYSTIYRAPYSLAEMTPFTLQWEVVSATMSTALNATVDVLNTGDDADVTVRIIWDTSNVQSTKNIASGETKTYTLSCPFPVNPGEAIYLKVGNYGPYELKYGDETNNYCHMTLTRGYVGGHIVDTGALTKGNTEQYNFEIQSDISFDRALLIHQMDQPHDYYGNPRYSGYTPQQLEANYPPIFKLNSGWTKPIIIDDKSYITINGKAMFERYMCRDYINSEWTSDSTGIAGSYNITQWGIISGQQDLFSILPCLVFKLKVGGWWWNGSGWTSTQTPFVVDLHTPTDDDGFVDFSSWWNTDLEIINNVSWEDWTGIDGYKIPLTGVNFDFNQDIEFSVCLPGRIQVYQGNKTHDGMNNYCWVKDLAIEFDTKGSENYELTDVVYENVIDEMSVNTLDDVTLKITTYPGEGQHSYSNVGYNGQLIDKVIKDGLDDEANKMEENIIKTYVNQWNTNTIEETMVLDRNATPLSRVKDTNNGTFFHVCGLEIDYARARQRVNLIQSKKWNQIEE